MSEKQRLAESLFAWAKTDQGWPLIRAALAKFPELSQETGGKWGESLLHWAALGNLSGVLDLIAHGAKINQPDLDQRKPIEWAVEKAYFVAVDPPEEMEAPIRERMLQEAEGCAIALAQAGADLGSAAEKKQGGYALVELALRAGLPALSEALLAGETDYSAELLWQWWLSGRWDRVPAGLKNAQAARVAIEKATGGSLVEFRMPGTGWTLGLVGVKLQLDGALSLASLALAHKAGARVDDPGEDGFGFEDLCARALDPVAAQLAIEKACDI